MNRFFMAFAAILTPGIFAFSYLKAWISLQYLDGSLPLKKNAEIVYPYFYRSEEIYLRVTLIFGLVFFVLGTASLFFTLKRDWTKVFLFFVLSLLAILAVMVNGAIKG